MTDHDGRCSTLLSAGSKLDVGIFKITFFTSECVVLPSAYLSAPLTRLRRYFTKRGILSFYPFVEVRSFLSRSGSSADARCTDSVRGQDRRGALPHPSPPVAVRLLDLPRIIKVVARGARTM